MLRGRHVVRRHKHLFGTRLGGRVFPLVDVRHVRREHGRHLGRFHLFERLKLLFGRRLRRVFQLLLDLFQALFRPRASTLFRPALLLFELFFARKYALHRLLFLFELFAQSLRVQPLLPRLYLRHLRLALRRNLALGKQHAVDRQIDAAKLRLGDLGVRLLEHVADLRNAEVGRQLVVLALFLFVLPLLRLFRLLFGMLLVRDGLGDLFLHGRNVRLLGLFLFRRLFLFLFVRLLDLFLLLLLLFGHVRLVEERHVLRLAVDEPLHDHVGQTHHVADQSVDLFVDGHLLDVVLDLKAHLCITFDELPQHQSLFEVGIFENDVGARDRRPHGRAVDHLLGERRRQKVADDALQLGHALQYLDVAALFRLLFGVGRQRADDLEIAKHARLAHEEVALCGQLQNVVVDVRHLDRVETARDEIGQIFEQRVDEPVLVDLEALFLGRVEDLVGGDVALFVDRGDHVGMLRQMLDRLGRDRARKRDVDDVLFDDDELARIADDVVQIDDAGLDHLDPIQLEMLFAVLAIELELGARRAQTTSKSGVKVL